MNRVMTTTGQTIEVPSSDDVERAKTWIIRRLMLVLAVVLGTVVPSAFTLGREVAALQRDVQQHEEDIRSMSNLSNELTRSTAEVRALAKSLDEFRTDLRELRNRR